MEVAGNGSRSEDDKRAEETTRIPSFFFSSFACCISLSSAPTKEVFEEERAFPGIVTQAGLGQVKALPKLCRRGIE